MPPTAWRLLAIASLLITPALAATRPHYGGTLRVQMKSQPTALDPTSDDALAPLVFDRLVTFSDSGQPQPALATAWNHDDNFKRWELQIRPGVQFHDKSPLTATSLAPALAPLAATAHGDTIVIASVEPVPQLLHTLASISISKRAADGSTVGTGPFRVAAWEPARRAVFAANEDYWAGRPYLDAVEVEMGRSLRNQALDLDLNKADIVELGVVDTRRAMQNGKRVWTSPPVDLLAIVFDNAIDMRAREAIALSIDRATIHNVILQKQGIPAAAILPQWLSGYAFLFPVARDLDRAHTLAPGAPPLTLAYNPADPTARLIAERIAVNAREAGLTVRPVAAGVQAASAQYDPHAHQLARSRPRTGVGDSRPGPCASRREFARGALRRRIRAAPRSPDYPSVSSTGDLRPESPRQGLGALAMGRNEARFRLACAMTFRAKLLAASAATVLVAVAVDSLIVEATTRSAFERLDSQRSAALVAQLQREYERRKEEVMRRTERIAASDVLQRMALDEDHAAYLEEARTQAIAQGLDFVELTAPDGAIISSAQWPARYGYKDEWVSRMASSGIQEATLKSEELPEETALALMAVRVASAGEKNILVAGGQKLDKQFLASLDPPEGMRVLLYRNLQPAFSPQALTGPDGPVPDAETFVPLIAQARSRRKDSTRVIGLENFLAMPRLGRDGDLLAILLVGSSRAGLVNMEKDIRRLGLAVAAMGVLLGVLLAWWVTTRITRPVHELAAAAGEVAAGNWNAHVPVQSGDEIGELAAAFNQMTHHLTDQRERLVQSERVAAWRELARRLAHELKNPLFPLQITVENMQRARNQYPEQFDEVFREGAATLLAELANLKTIINRFSDFSKMPPPDRRPTNVNELLRGVLKLFDAQLAAAGHRPPRARSELPNIQADPAQLHRVLQNLVLNASTPCPRAACSPCEPVPSIAQWCSKFPTPAPASPRRNAGASLRRTTPPSNTVPAWASQ
jgi:ABC-type dipeptide transport system, periplasmic component